MRINTLEQEARRYFSSQYLLEKLIAAPVIRLGGIEIIYFKPEPSAFYLK